MFSVRNDGRQAHDLAPLVCVYLVCILRVSSV
jgi:hypothetical protein